jgi:hypothetical protein
MAFSYTADAISDAMIAKIKAGLVVKGVFESQNANGNGGPIVDNSNGFTIDPLTQGF